MLKGFKRAGKSGYLLFILFFYIEIPNSYGNRSKVFNFSNRQWHEKAQQNPVLKHTNNLRKLLSKLKLTSDFPSDVVHNAYINPDVDKSNEEFSWSIPSLDQLRQLSVHLVEVIKRLIK